MKQILIFGLVGLYAIVAFQTPNGFAHPLMAFLQGLDTAFKVEIHVDPTVQEGAASGTVFEL